LILKATIVDNISVADDLVKLLELNRDLYQKKTNIYLITLLLELTNAYLKAASDKAGTYLQEAVSLS
jgi:hypothetical protein